MKYEGMKEMNINKITKFALLLVCFFLFFATASRAMPAASASLEADLLAAAKMGELAKVKSLVASGVDVNITGKGGATPLGLAASRGHIDIVRALIKAGADIHWEAPEGQTVLSVAAYKRHTNVVRTLIDAGADVNAKIKSDKAPVYYQGATALFPAIRGGSIETIRVLIDAGADVNAKNRNSMTPIMFASDSSDIGPLLVLIDPQVNPNSFPPTA